MFAMKKKQNSYILLNKALEFHGQGELAQAQKLCSEIIDKDPTFAEAWNVLGVIALAISQPMAAINLFKQAVDLNEGNAGYLVNLAHALKHVSQFSMAEEFYRKAISIEPENVEFQLNLAQTLVEMSDHQSAINICKKLLDRDNASPGVLRCLGHVYQRIDDHQNAITIYNELMKIAPEMNDINFAMSVSHIAVGDFLSAKQDIEHLLTQDPLHAEAHRVLSWLKKYKSSDDEHLKNMESIFNRPDRNDEQRMHLGFGLGKGYQDVKDFDRSFYYYKEANRLKRASFQYDPQEDVEQVDRLTSLFDELLIDRHISEPGGGGNPVFILGMPRSGTSLVEQILSSHSKLEGIGESSAMRRTMHTFCVASDGRLELDRLRDFSRQQFLEMGRFYLKQLPDHSKSLSIIDKTPTNFLYVGLIRLMLPGAKIIHTQRNAMDTCLSIFQTHLIGAMHRYAFDLKELGLFYKQYERIMAHWHEVLPPDSILDVRYESVISDQEAESRKMIAYVGLEWEDECLSFYENRRIVNTASASQVRQPIYGSSVERWRSYEKHLELLHRNIMGDQV